MDIYINNYTNFAIKEAYITVSGIIYSILFKWSVTQKLTYCKHLAIKGFLYTCIKENEIQSMLCEP